MGIKTYSRVLQWIKNKLARILVGVLNLASLFAAVGPICRIPASDIGTSSSKDPRIDKMNVVGEKISCTNYFTGKS